MAAATCVPATRALVGPPDEYLCDGGDFGLPAAVRADWTVDGLEQEDAIAHYDTVDGRVVVTPSNRVCVYAPRFAAVRRVENLLAHERRQLIDVAVEETAPVSSAEVQPVVASTQRNGVAINLGERPANLFRGREQAAEYVQARQHRASSTTRSVPYANLEIIRTGAARRQRAAAHQTRPCRPRSLGTAIRPRRSCSRTGRRWRSSASSSRASSIKPTSRAIRDCGS